ncbi:periplasmic heavy metal sensor [Lichenicola cladoniae]|uniref:Periplasmic heavy metal sensor n=1 Tax=Lichenicola cladoniae TaxID=1484109 RepID=A0A6M8HVH6_9PROT|nr:Spy/CpxP family protein refolding chaperone [Lichenicola cladoniae]NPD69485.1 periplasmic heavy metal sensor [Acetobacteraceae bacterium]QKE92147.1 periplasmic heavy metal sensor [Lichenicola cladoniae]
MFTFKIIAAAAVLGVASAGAAFAQPGHGGGPGGWHHGDGLLDGVTLTDTQKTKVHALMKAEHQDSKSLRDQIHAIHEQIETTLLSAGDVTEATIAPLEQQETSLMQQLGAKHVASEIAVRNLLTSDQIAKAASIHAQLTALHDQEHALHQAGETPSD